MHIIRLTSTLEMTSHKSNDVSMSASFQLITCMDGGQRSAWDTNTEQVFLSRDLTNKVLASQIGTIAAPV